MLHPHGIEEVAWALARRWNLPAAYDAAYLALAEVTGGELWTADRRFAASLPEEGAEAPSGVTSPVTGRWEAGARA